MLVMAASAVIAAVCCLGAGRAVPWQGRQCTVVMAVAMIGLVLTAGDAGASLLAAVVLIVSAMLGTAGLRRATAVRACCHRALGSLVMALCAFGGIAHGTVGGSSVSGSSMAEPGHGTHLSMDSVGALATLGVALLVTWTIVDRFRTRPRGVGSRLLAVESWAMTAGVIAMWAAH